MSELLVAGEALTLVLYAAVCVLTFQRSKTNKKRLIVFAAFFILFLYSSLNFLNRTDILTGTNEVRHLLKSVGYAVLLGSFVYLIFERKYTAKLSSPILALAAINALLFAADHFIAGHQHHLEICIASLLFLSLLVVAHLMRSGAGKAAASMVAGTGFMTLAYVSSFSFGHLHFSEVIGLVAGTLLIVYAVLSFYEVL